MKHLLRFCFLMLALCVGLQANAQEVTVSGKVTDQNGESLPGVYILIKGSTQGTVTDYDGNFTITADANATLVAQFLGYASQEIPVGSQTTINIQLAEQAQDLDEVVVTGLGTSVKRSNLANAVSTISAKELVGTTSPSTLDGGLYGKLTGVNIVQNSGAPGGGIAIRLRGVSSILGQNQPLIILDGVYIDNSEVPSGLRFASGANNGAEENASNRLADIDPADIENIEVLKGASAAAIYGNRANAGVIIITTKRGKPGRTSIDFAQDVGFSTILNKVGTRNFTSQTVLDAFGPDAQAEFDAVNGRQFDYEDEIFGEEGLILNTRLSVTGGNQKTSFYVGGSYRNEEGIVKRTGFIRRNLRANISHKFNKFLDIRAMASFVNSEANRSFTGNENEGGLSYGYTLAFTRPWVDLFPDEDGNYPNNPNYPGNPLFVRDQTTNRERTYRTINALTANMNFINNETSLLRFTFSGGVDFTFLETLVIVPREHQAQLEADNGLVAQGSNQLLNTNFQGILLFTKNTGRFDLTSQLGVTRIRNERNLFLSRVNQLAVGPFNLGLGSSINNTQDNQKEEDFGLFAQQEVNFEDKIVVTAGIRLDKSTLNGDENKFYAFPKASLAVNLAEFDFIDNAGLINLLKLRVAWGQTGSTARFGSTFTSLVGDNTILGNNSQVINGTRGNADIEPERASEIEAGIDVGLLNNRLTFELTLYNRQINDLIIDRAVPGASGFTSQIGNFADLKNRGIELGINAIPVTSPKITWATTLNFWLNRSEVTRLEGPPFAAPNSAFGLGLGSFYVEEGSTITQIAGNNGDGVPTKVGDTEPDFQMSWFNTVTFFKNFELRFLWHWKQGGEVLNLSRFLTDIGQTTFDLDEQSGMERTTGTFDPLATQFIEDGTYLRLREIALYYTLPREFVKNTFGGVLQNLRVGVSAYNILTFTDYSWYDPEVSTKGGSGLSNSVDVTPFPSSKKFYFHLVASF